MARYIKESELIINDDGSIFHLHLKPGEIADKIIIVGDPARVDMISSYFDSIELTRENREFKTVTGNYRGKRLTALSHGIGGGCIDIVMTELDALANIDFEKRTPKEDLTSLSIVRMGTCGGLQENTPVGTFICSDYSIGFDSLLNFYAGSDAVCIHDLEKKFMEHTGWRKECGLPYAVQNSRKLIEKIAKADMVHGITCSACGFYAPQGRFLRASLAMEELNEKLYSFEYSGLKVTNFEMEGAQVGGLASILGHEAATVCMVVANRFAGNADSNYKNSIGDLIRLVLDRI